MVKKGFLFLLFMLLPGLVLAELPCSQFRGDIPPPDVPTSEVVSETYFYDAVFLGDSLMASMELHGHFPDSFYAVAVGIGPQTAMGPVYDTNTGKKNLKQLLEPLDFSKIYVLLGANTIDNMASDAASERYAIFLAKLVEAYPAKLIYVISIPPRTRNPMEDKLPPSPQRISKFNQAIRGLCETYGIYYLDVFSRMMLVDGTVAREFMGSDGLHLSRKGSEMVRDYLMTHTVKELP
jgi:lysophospholipase L1-like esterase